MAIKPSQTHSFAQIYTEATNHSHIYKNDQDTHLLSQPTNHTEDNSIQHIPSMQHNNTITQHIQSAFQHIEPKCITEFCLSLFPICRRADPYECIEEAIKSFYQIKKNGLLSLDSIKELILKKGQEVGHGVKKSLQQLFSQPEYCRQIQNSVKFINTQIIQIQQKPKDKGQSVKSQRPRKIGDSQKSLNTKRSDPIKYKPLTTNSQIDHVVNIADRGLCICDSKVNPQEDTFLCVHCSFSYHLECMKKKDKAKNCTMCHLKKIIPNRDTKKTLFIGLLKKGKRKHQFSIFFSEQDLSMRQMKYKLQVRCFRLKQATQNFLLFPDSTKIQINNFQVKQFNPLHRQSSLKYRKDEPFYIQLKHLLPKENKIIVYEKLPSKEYKDLRIEAEHHVIGFFIVEEKRVDTLVKEITFNSITPFEQSRKILDSAFIPSSGLDGVSCEVVKIPLICFLTTDKIKFPARGLFCTHFQCFDLSNYLMMTSQSTNPRWICPLCKQPCYSFKIDCILLAILQEYSQQALTEAMFFRNGMLKVLAGQAEEVNKGINTIYDLPIETIAKRIATQMFDPQKKKRKLCPIPESSQIIQLDQTESKDSKEQKKSKGSK